MSDALAIIWRENRPSLLKKNLTSSFSSISKTKNESKKADDDPIRVHFEVLESIANPELEGSDPEPGKIAEFDVSKVLCLSILRNCIDRLRLIKSVSSSKMAENSVTVEYKSLEKRFGALEKDYRGYRIGLDFAQAPKILSVSETLIHVLREQYDETRIFGKFTSLNSYLDSINQMELDSGNMLKTCQAQQKFSKNLQTKELRTRPDDDDQFRKLDQEITKYYKKWIDLEEHARAEKAYVQKWEKARHEQNKLVLENNNNFFQLQIVGLADKISNEKSCHQNIVNFLNESHQNFRSKISTWMEKYDREFDQKDMELYEKSKKMEEMKHKKQQFQDVFLKRCCEIESWIASKKLKKLEEIYLRSQNRAAVIIQMDRISTAQLHQYDSLLDEINNEYAKGEQLKKEIENLDNRIIALKLSLADYNRKISHVNVKVFDSVWEIYNLYESDVKPLEGAPDNCKFYLVEVFLAKSLLEKLIQAQWKLQICIYNREFAVSNVISLENKTPILGIIPIRDDVEECTVESALFLQSYDSCHIIDLHHVNVDISYHFQDSAKSDLKPIDKISSLSSLYKGLKCDNLQTVPQLQTQIKLNNFNKSKFVETIIKNSYHKLEIDLFSEFVNDNKQTNEVQFYIGLNLVILSYNNDTSILKIKCSADVMLSLKKFFFKYSSFDEIKKRKGIAKIIAQYSDLESMESDDLLEMYQEIRKLFY